MNLSRKKIYISALGFVLALASCAKKNESKSNDSNNESTNVTAPTQDHLSKEEFVTLYKKNAYDNLFYTAKNFGGLGIENSEDSLDLYSGIPIQVNQNYETNVSIYYLDNSDLECKYIFSYTTNSPHIIINFPSFGKPLTCNLSLNITAKNKKTGVVVITPANKIKVRINLTMKAYMDNNDPNYLQFSGQQYPDDGKLIKIIDEIKENRKITISKLSLDNFNFLEGAKDFIQTFEIKESSVNNYSILKEFRFINDMTLDKLKLDDINAKTIMQMLPLLNRLSIRDNLLTSLRTIYDTQPNLISLDISGNPIKNLSEVINFSKLSSLSLRKMNLTTLLPLYNVTQIKDLDISENPLRKFTEVDTKYLSSLINLEALNVSVDRDNPNSTPITDKVLDDYFRNNGKQKLKKFVARNRWQKRSKDCNMINNFNESVGSINILKSIEYLDLHGNGCVDALGFYSGLIMIPLMSFKNLKHLNISDTPTRSFESSIDWRNPNITFIFNETPDNYDTGVFMSRVECLSTFPEGNKNRKQCDGLDPKIRSN